MDIEDLKADFLPLLHQIEHDFRGLERATGTDYPQALSNMKAASKRWCVQSLEKELVDTITFKSRYQRTELVTDKVILSEIMLKIESLVKRLQESIPILAAGGFTEKDFVSNFGPSGSAQLFNKQMIFDQYGLNGPSPDPYATYRDILKDIRAHLDLCDLVQILHSYLPEDLAINLFELTKGIPQKELPADPNIPNWPGIENCLRTFLAFRTRLDKDRRAGKSPFEAREFDYLLSKLDLIKLMAFNSTENRQSKRSKVVRNLDLDLTPYISQPEKILTEFFSPTEYVMKCFRNVLKLMSYDILAIEGDGNCFFRATIKSLFPNVPRDWEDSLSVMVRKSLNKGEMQRAIEKGVEYPYQGFVITNVNDSVTMAKVGVWADHIQVQKLAHQLQRPVWLVLYDDMQLQMDLDGNLIPGRDYNIGNGKGAPLVLYFTPSPGHYEVLLPQKRKEYTMSEHMKALEVIIGNFQNSRGDFGQVPPGPLCAAFFKIAEEAMQIREIAKNFGQASEELKEVIKMDIKERCSLLMKNMKGFWATLSFISPRYLAARNDPREFIYLDVISTIFKDAITWNGDHLASMGTGPLSQIYNLVAQALASTMSPQQYGQQQPYTLWNWFA